MGKAGHLPGYWYSASSIAFFLVTGLWISFVEGVGFRDVSHGSCITGLLGPSGPLCLALHSDQPGASLAPGRGFVDRSGKKTALQIHRYTDPQNHRHIDTRAF